MNPRQCLLTMIVPVRNRPQLIERLLGCISRGADSRVRFIIADNGSTDSTPETVARWIGLHPELDGRITLISEPRSGACAARNSGLALADTPYVMFFDSDDVFDAEHLRSVADYIESADGGAPDIIVWEVAIDPSSGLRRLPPTRPTLLHHLFHASLATQRYAVRTDFLRRAGGWNEWLPVWNDYELGVRLLTAAPSIGRLSGSTPHVTIIPTPDSITAVRWTDRAGLRELSLDAVDIDLREAGLDSRYGRYVDARRMILAAHYAREGDYARARALTALVRGRGYGLRERAALEVVYAAVRVAGRGGAAVAMLLL